MLEVQTIYLPLDSHSILISIHDQFQMFFFSFYAKFLVKWATVFCASFTDKLILAQLNRIFCFCCWSWLTLIRPGWAWKESIRYLYGMVHRLSTLHLTMLSHYEGILLTLQLNNAICYTTEMCCIPPGIQHI